MAAIVEVLGAVQTALEAVNLSVVTDRQEDDRIAADEGEVVALGWQGADSSTPTSCANYFWNAQIAIEVWVNVTMFEQPLVRFTEILAQVSGVFNTDRTFGSKFHDSNITAISGLEDMTGDRGTITVTASIQYWTTRADITAIATD